MTQQTDTIIIGGGLTGLTIAHKLRVSCYGHRFIVLEKGAATGGVIHTHRENGYIAEAGPHGFLDNCRESNELLEETGLSRECIKSPLLNFVRYVLIDGHLKVIPQTPLKIIRAPLIPWKDKLRVVKEIWQPPLEGEPTVARWVNHRFGPALLPFADAVFTGTYAGDIDRLTIDSVMPGIRRLELEHGSVIRGLFARARQAGKSSHGRKKFTMPAMTSFPMGMQRLPERLNEYLVKGDNLRLNCCVEAVNMTEGGWHVSTSCGVFSADNIVFALPVNDALALLSKLSTPPVLSVAGSRIATVVFAFGPGSSLPPGFGYLSPEREDRFSLGTLFSSNMFPGRAPEGHILFETLVGGRRHPERLELSDEQLIQGAHDDVKQILPISGEPLFTRVLRPWGAIPQLEGNYPALLEWRDNLVKEHKGLHICGFGWEGIGLNDMIKSGVRTAAAIRAGSERSLTDAELKGIYF